MSQKYQKYVFSDSERNTLKMARESAPPEFDEPSSHGNWVAFYTKLSEILGAHIDAGTVTGPDLQDFKSVKLWTDVAISANGGAGLHSTFIRAFTDYQGYLRLGRHFSAEEMQKASNGVTLNLYLSLSGLRSVDGYDPWTVPTIVQIARDDASSIGINLYADHLSESDDAVVFNTGWSGTLGFNLLGGEEPFESWRLLAEPARDGLEAASRPENQRLDSFDDFKNILFATAAYEAAWKASSFEVGAVAAYELARFIAFVQTRRLLPGNDAYLRSIAAQIEINLANDNWLGLVKDVAAFSPAISPAVNLMADVGPANFLDMMRSAYEGQALLWQTKHAQFQDAAYAFFSPISAQQREGIGARMLPMEQEQLVRMARSDVDVRNALQALSALSVDTAAVGLDTSHLQIYDAQSGTGRLTERWLQDRAAFLIAQTQELQQGNGSVLRDPQRLRYYDMGSEQEVLQGFGSHRRQIVFGAAGGSNLQGQGFDDRLYGGDEADRLEGKGGSDHLEGGQGHDTYVLSSDDSGVDTIVDVDGDGHLEVDGSAISGVYKRYHSQSTSYYSADGRTRIDVLPNGVHTKSQGPEGQAGAAGRHTLGVYRLDGTQWRQLAHVLDWKGQGLGLQLSDELGEPERHVVTLGGDRYYDTFEAADRPVQISTGDKRDYVNGSAFSDHISLGESHDIALAGLGNDFIDGGAGGDFILAGPDVREPGASANDHDVLVGGAGRDKLKGGAGDDVLYAMAMEDDIDSEGAATGDWLLGGSGDDMLHGSRAGDVLNGGAGNDRIRGGSDSDFYILQAGDGQGRLIEVLGDSAAHDIIELRGLASSDSWQLRRVSQDLHLHYGVGGQDLLIVQDQFAAGAMAIEEIRFSDGVSLSA
ncbi:calcium-binding protein [Vandammella animalimorsus]|uniref:Haemolysin-type calcium binding-related domain-containing protein n=1 Tax=Vandammella animalimorsus TaxID=2029117 RepID=A0A2A2AHR2_9BURK|nr:calcium-binding protein [Vandammella animalimorsus]PAT37261.1 hypothetical protein CK625_06460 [Vandammella animalimorsus]